MKNSKPQFVSTIALLYVVLFLFINQNSVSAQPVESLKKWHYLTDIYLMFPNMNGETGVGDKITVPVEANPGDILSNLKMAAMLYLEANTNKWAITSDFVYMKLGQNVTESKLLQSGEVSLSQIAWEVGGLYRIMPFWEAGVGGRLNNIGADIDVRKYVPGIGNPTEQVIESASKTWFDPILMTRLSTDIKDKWFLQFRGDIGGFGVGSDLTWQLQGYAGYHVTKVFQLTAGYRYLSADYDKGEGTERFIYKVATFGPVVKFGFNF